MADISKCKGEGCIKKQTCYRFLAPSSSWQSFIKPDPSDCKMYWNNEPQQLKKRKKDQTND